MSAALECWSARPSTDDEILEQVLITTSSPPSLSSVAAAPQPKKWQRLGRNVAGAITALKNSLSIDSSSRDRFFEDNILRGLTDLYPGSQLPEKLISSARRHFDSLPNSYVQAGFDMKDVLLHVRLIEQAVADDHPAVHIEEFSGEGNADCTGFRISFGCNVPISWPAISAAMDSSLISYKKMQIFEKKGLTLGVVTVLVHQGGERQFKARIEAALRSAVKKPKNNGVKLAFGFCGCQEEGSRNVEDDGQFNGDDEQGFDNEGVRRVQLPNPLPISSFVVSVDEWQTIRSGGYEITRWLLRSDEINLGERIGKNSFKGEYKGKRVCIKKIRGCERGTAYDIEMRQDLLQLMSCGQRNILQFYGLCIEENQGLCVVTRLMEGGSVHDIIQKNKKIPVREVLRIAVDVAEALMFMNNHGISYQDLNVQRILRDRQGNACLGDMGIVTSCSTAGEVTEYETAGYRWLAPEIIAGDPESVTETWMSNVYSFGMILWEMVTGEAAYSTYSPVQAAVGIAACGLRPDIPKNCPQILCSLMLKCWNNCPTKRPRFSEIIATLEQQNAC